MTVFVDTSALFALLDADDEQHHEAATVFGELAGSVDLVTHSYVHVETIVLTARRLGPLATRALLDDLPHPALLPLRWATGVLTS